MVLQSMHHSLSFLGNETFFEFSKYRFSLKMQRGEYDKIWCWYLIYDLNFAFNISVLILSQASIHAHHVFKCLISHRRSNNRRDDRRRRRGAVALYSRTRNSAPSALESMLIFYAESSHSHYPTLCTACNHGGSARLWAPLSGRLLHKKLVPCTHRRTTLRASYRFTSRRSSA